MSKLSQKEAVYRAVLDVLSAHGLDATNKDVNSLMTREMRQAVNEILIKGFKEGQIELKKEFSDSELKAYVSGLQSNWLRKDTRLNGGIQYMIKNPGSRAGSKDEVIKNLKALKSTLTNPEEIAEIDAAIKTRLEELKPSKKVEIDFSVLPESIKSKYNH